MRNLYNLRNEGLPWHHWDMSSAPFSGCESLSPSEITGISVPSVPAPKGFSPGTEYKEPEKDLGFLYKETEKGICWVSFSER